MRRVALPWARQIKFLMHRVDPLLGAWRLWRLIRQVLCDDIFCTCTAHRWAWKQVRTPAIHPLMLAPQDPSDSAVIFLNAIWMSVDTDNNPAAVLVDAPPIFIVMENLFCLFFTTELLIRFVAFDRKRDCCRDFWFVFDCVINIYMIGETWILSLILLLSDMTTTEALFDASALRIIRMVKILRLSRMAKLLRAIPELSIVIKAIGAAGRSMLDPRRIWVASICVGCLAQGKLGAAQMPLN
eukprot:g30615.t1